MLILNDDYSVSYKGETFILLPKEFALFSFLYSNRGITFSRDTILERVWGLSDSTDRTVDDHIYRLRKKLKFIDIVAIETIRSSGYRLMLKTINQMENPLQQDNDFQSALELLFSKYINYGQGKGLTLLANQQEHLDLSISHEREIYLHFFQGDFQWIVNETSISFWEKAFYFLHIYSIIQFDSLKTLTFFEKIINTKKLPSQFQTEIEMLTVIDKYIRAGHFEISHQKINDLYLTLNSMENEAISFYVFNLDLKLQLYSRNWDNAYLLIIERFNYFQSCPFQREKGQFSILCGMYYYLSDKHKDVSKAKHLLNDGLDLLEKSGFKPNFINGLNIILSLFGVKIVDTPYHNLWNQLKIEYQFSKLEKEIEQQFVKNLDN